MPPGPAASSQVAVTGWSLHVPGFDPAGRVPWHDRDPSPRPEPPACPPAAAHELLGRKGLLNKDAATRLALCAVHRALGLPPGTGRAAGPPDPGVAVVASSNLGNLPTVIGVVRAVRAGRRKDISPLLAAGTSSNVIASAVAIWFGFGGPNLMICSGATSGLDAVAVGGLLLRAGRAARVVVVGAEPSDEIAAALYARRSGGTPLREGAACVVLEPADAAPDAPRLGAVVSPAGDPAADPGVANARWGALVGPAGSVGRPGRRRIDLAGICGDLYGAHGVAQTAVAAAVIAAERGDARQAPGTVGVVCGDATDGWRVLELSPGGGRCGGGTGE